MLETILTVVLVAVSIALIVVILMQEGKGNGLSGGIAGGYAGDTYVSKNQGRTREGKLKNATKLLTAAFVILALVIDILK